MSLPTMDPQEILQSTGGLPPSYFVLANESSAPIADIEIPPMDQPDICTDITGYGCNIPTQPGLLDPMSSSSSISGPLRESSARSDTRKDNRPSCGQSENIPDVGGAGPILQETVTDIDSVRVHPDASQDKAFIGTRCSGFMLDDDGFHLCDQGDAGHREFRSPLEGSHSSPDSNDAVLSYSIQDHDAPISSERREDEADPVVRMLFEPPQPSCSHNESRQSGRSGDGRLVVSLAAKAILEESFQLELYPSGTVQNELARRTGLNIRQVKTWFNNTRSRRFRHSEY